ncbi:hypothetical protein RCL1_004222 [Eukaryota sp. TZLM3-RCL]
MIPLFVKDSCCPVYLHLKPHKGTTSDFPVGRTLFVANALGLSLPSLITFLSTYGKLESHHSNSDGSQLHFIFEKRDSFNRVIDLTTLDCSSHFLSLNSFSEDSNIISNAFSNYFSSSSSDCKQIHEEVNTFIKNAEKEKEEEEIVPDDDGFVPVSKRKAATLPPSTMPPTKKCNTVIEGFYSFQRRSKRQDELVSLRKSFEADKAKIAAMKMNRKFKPI